MDSQNNLGNSEPSVDLSSINADPQEDTPAFNDQYGWENYVVTQYNLQLGLHQDQAIEEDTPVDIEILKFKIVTLKEKCKTLGEKLNHLKDENHQYQQMIEIQTYLIRELEKTSKLKENKSN